jgi:hypothetical protein
MLISLQHPLEQQEPPFTAIYSYFFLMTSFFSLASIISPLLFHDSYLSAVSSTEQDSESPVQLQQGFSSLIPRDMSKSLVLSSLMV